MGEISGAIKYFFRIIPPNVVTLYFTGAGVVTLTRLLTNFAFAAQSIPGTLQGIAIMTGHIIWNSFLPFADLSLLSISSVDALIGAVALIAGKMLLNVLAGAFIWTKAWYKGIKAVTG